VGRPPFESLFEGIQPMVIWVAHDRGICLPRTQMTVDLEDSTHKKEGQTLGGSVEI